MKAIKRPIAVDVWQLDNKSSCPKWVEGAMYQNEVYYHAESNCWKIDTLEGVMTAHNGDYLIKGVHGELYPCKREVFEETYEIIEESLPEPSPWDGWDGWNHR